MSAISKVKQTLSTLKGAEATLRMYYVQEQNKEAKFIYSKSLEEINKINMELDKRIKTMEFEEPQYKGN
ncbi:MAG: DUF1657 domain-containing protein [Clostridium sp.]|uniref:DUF1657 domain-containing protein n=1 Tax=Clostridium sp. TaxID=1506 RepID=UPI0025BFFD18|nr:DUF1657 domain-containing protein [Clostridium sp.]MCF0148614.1 DUF1657 domain-containing protein [Clostridium sp.]